MSVFEGNRALLDAFRRGEREALTLVFNHYAETVAALIRRGFSMDGRGTVPGVREPQQQRDLTQEVFLRAFSEKGRLGYDGLSPFRPWLLRIAKNLMIDEGRRAGRLQADDGSPTSQLASAEPAVLPVSPEDELEWKTLREATQAWCTGLSPDLRRFVQLRFEDELSQVEVASALGVSRRQVRTMEESIRAELRRHLKSQGLVPP